MKAKKIISIILIIISVFMLYKFLEINYFTNKKESFTSGFRMMYRPHIRNIRLIGGNYYNNLKNNMHTIFRKFGLI